MATKQTIKVSRLPGDLTDALERLLKKDLAQRGFVIVDHAPTCRYLQFCTDPESGVLLFDKGGFRGIVRPPPFVMKPLAVRTAVAVTEGIMRGCGTKDWGLTGDDEVSITEDDAESRWKGLMRESKKWYDEVKAKVRAIENLTPADLATVVK